MKINVKMLQHSLSRKLLLGAVVQGKIISKFIEDNLYRIPKEEQANWVKEMWQNGRDNWYHRCDRFGDLVYFYRWAALLGLSKRGGSGRVPTATELGEAA